MKLTSTGISVSATKSDANREMVTVTENGRKKRLMIPPTTPMGRNTATLVRVLEITAEETSVAPCRAASLGLSPCCRWR